MAKKLNIGLLGYSFMGKAHSNAFRKVSMFFPESGVEPVMKVICGSNKKNVKAAANSFGNSPPTPTPKTRRPLLIRSSVATCFATASGWRSANRKTEV